IEASQVQEVGQARKAAGSRGMNHQGLRVRTLASLSLGQIQFIRHALEKEFLYQHRETTVTKQRASAPGATFGMKWRRHSGHVDRATLEIRLAEQPTTQRALAKLA